MSDPAALAVPKNAFTTRAAQKASSGGLTYLAVVGAMYGFERSMIYHPSSTVTDPTKVLRDAAVLTLQTPDKENILAWHVPPKDNKPVIIYFHGNGETIGSRLARFQKITHAGYGLLAVSYRGYSSSTGHPTEDGLHNDAVAAYAFAARRYPTERIAVWGYSLGTGVAVRLASEQHIGKLVLEAPYTSISDVASNMFPFLPTRMMMRDQFRSDEHIQNVEAPILILHGTRDQIVPVRLGKRLFELAPEPKQFIQYPDGDHMDLDRRGATDAVIEFLASPNLTLECEEEAPQFAMR